jgi:hypothetical protein
MTERERAQRGVLVGGGISFLAVMQTKLLPFNLHCELLRSSDKCDSLYRFINRDRSIFMVYGKSLCTIYVIAQHIIIILLIKKKIGQHKFEISFEKAIKIYSKHLGAIAAGSQCSVLSAHFLSGGCLISTQRERCINILLGRRQSARCTRERERQRPCCNAKNKTTCSRASINI